MQIFINSIIKNRNDFKEEIDNYIKMSKKFANINDQIFFNEKIAKAQSKDKKSAKKSYDEIYLPLLKGYNVALDERGEMLNSYEFAKIFDKDFNISFFIGGAYGLSDDFKSKVDKVVSLSRLTTSHKIAKLMLFEQIFRSLCIKANHPYHK